METQETWYITDIIFGRLSMKAFYHVPNGFHFFITLTIKIIAVFKEKVLHCSFKFYVLTSETYTPKMVQWQDDPFIFIRSGFNENLPGGYSWD